jgi:hypothetical protein
LNREALPQKMPQVGFEPTPSEDDCNLSATP